MQHMCISPHSWSIKCLNLSQANDGVVDCFGGFDERYHCRNITDRSATQFMCSDNNNYCYLPDILCDGSPDCLNGEDERICEYLYVSEIIYSVHYSTFDFFQH